MAELPLDVEERLARLEKLFNKLNTPPMDLLLQEGYFQIGSTELAGAVRLDGKRMQIAAGGSSGLGGMWFVPVLYPDPNDVSVPKGYILGQARTNGTTAITISTIDPDPPNAPTAGVDIELDTPGSSDYARQTTRVYVDDSLAGGQEWSEAWLNRVFGEAAGTFQLYQALLRLCPSQAAGFPFTSDPANAIEGDIWYNTTDNQFKFYEGSTIKTLGGGMSTKVKEADETVTTNTTLQNDDELLFAVAANEVWQFEGVLFLTAPAAADFKMTFTGPTGAVGAFTGYYDTTSDAGDRAQGGTLGTSVSFALTVDGVSLRFFGGIHNGANAGNLQLQWAQDTSSGSTLVLAGSYIKYQLANT